MIIGMKHGVLSNTKGAFLLEALLATIILGFGLTAIIASFSMGIDGHKRSQEYLKASVLLENKLADLLLKRYFDDSLVGEGTFEDPFSEYRYDITAQDVSSSNSLKEMHVKVLWAGRQVDRSLEAVTYMLVQLDEEN